MNLATSIRFGLARLLYKSAGLTIVPSWVQESFIKPSFRSLVQEAYSKNAAVFSCVSTLAFGFIEPPVRVYDGDGDDARMLPKHGLRQLLTKPNPRMGEAGLKLHTITYAAVGGNAYWHKVRGRANQVVELWPYHAGQIRAVPGGPTWIKHYVFDDGTGNLVVIPVEDIVHFQWPSPDPDQPWQALPPLAAAAREIDTDNEITRYLFALLKNDAVPRTALRVPPGSHLKDDEIRRMRQQWRERYGGENRGDVAILEEGAEIQRIGLDLAELAFDALHRIPETRIAAVLRVPPILAGLAAGLERSTFSNHREARQSFTEDTLVPLWGLFGSTISAQLLPDFGGAAEVRADTSRVKALQEDNDKRWSRAGTAYTRGLVTKNEGRRYLGYSDVKDGDEFYTPQGRQALAEGAPKQLPAPARKAAHKRARPTDALKGTTDSIEERIARSVEQYLAGQYQLAAEAIRDQAKADAPLDPAIVEQLGLDLGTQMRQLLTRYYPLLLSQAFADQADALDLELAFDLENTAVQDTLSELAQLVTRVADTTRDEIRALVGRQASEGWSIDELAREIAGLAEIHSRRRAVV
ncbi:MAG TPA: phage portal protein, partial [Roseiflexaceae bacterium]|nr:phage portal protein [Roseiflexaceae bacterium]